MYLYNVALTSMQRHERNVSAGMFATVEILTKHQHVHTINFICVICGKQFSDAANYRYVNIKCDTQAANHLAATYAAEVIGVLHININWRETLYMRNLWINVPLQWTFTQASALMYEWYDIRKCL